MGVPQQTVTQVPETYMETVQQQVQKMVPQESVTMVPETYMETVQQQVQKMVPQTVTERGHPGTKDRHAGGSDCLAACTTSDCATSANCPSCTNDLLRGTNDLLRCTNYVLCSTNHIRRANLWHHFHGGRLRRLHWWQLHRRRTRL